MKKLEDRPEYSRLIVELRKKAHMTQEQLADESGVPVTVIKKIELGIYMPPYSTIVKIANVLVGNPYEIMGSNFRNDGTTGYSEYVDKDFKKVKKLFPAEYEVTAGISGASTADDLMIVYEDNNQLVSSAYSKSQLVIDIIKIQDELKKKYDQELLDRVRALFEKICPPSGNSSQSSQ